ncbi:hypothetical protein Avbf_17979 [Armadillidium vulgare]|nr:hypothetical protein Avbf_17979 [Armadillidium vulgare]
MIPRKKPQITKNYNFHININFPACCSGPYSHFTDSQTYSKQYTGLFGILDFCRNSEDQVLCCETLDIPICEPIPAYVTSHQPTIPKGAQENLLHPCSTKSKYP